VFITLTENGPADWSVGDGQAQLADTAERSPLTRLIAGFGRSGRNCLAAATEPGPAGARAALETFYHAFNTADLELIRDIWLDDPLAQLNNPLGGSLLCASTCSAGRDPAAS
jgi:hypothetical protein